VVVAVRMAANACSDVLLVHWCGVMRGHLGSTHIHRETTRFCSTSHWIHTKTCVSVWDQNMHHVGERMHRGVLET
jgi:hypothetical protein